MACLFVALLIKPQFWPWIRHLRQPPCLTPPPTAAAAPAVHYRPARNAFAPVLAAAARAAADSGPVLRSVRFASAGLSATPLLQAVFHNCDISHLREVAACGRSRRASRRRCATAALMNTLLDTNKAYFVHIKRDLWRFLEDSANKAMKELVMSSEPPSSYRSLTGPGLSLTLTVTTT
jgi:hypothetical protein